MPYIRHVTLTANTVRTDTLTALDNASQVEIISRNALADVYVSYDGTANPANPTVGGNDFDVIPCAVGAGIRLRRIGSGNIVVRTISSAATTISIKAVQ